MIEQKDAYKHDELIECAKGNMFGEGNSIAKYRNAYV